MKPAILKRLCSNVLRAGSAALRAPRAIIVRYHAIRPAGAVDDPLPPGICHAPEELRAHLAMLCRYFHVITLPELLQTLEAGTPPPARSVVLTFDDGYADNLLVAAQIMDEFKVHASIFLTTGLIGTGAMPWFCVTRWLFPRATVSEWTEPTFGRRWTLGGQPSRDAARFDANLVCAALSLAERTAYLQELQRQLRAPPLPDGEPVMLRWDQVRQLLAAGHYIGSHTVSHPNLALLGRADAQWEIAESRRQLLAELGCGGDVLCYPNPFGEPIANSLTRELLVAAGYKAALVVNPGVIDCGVDRMCLPRIGSPSDVERFRFCIEKRFAGLE